MLPLHTEYPPRALSLHAMVLPATRHLQAHTQYSPRVRRRNDAIVPQSGRPKRRFAFVLDPGLERWIRLFANGLHDRRELLRTHDGRLRVGPCEE